MEILNNLKECYGGKKVLITGHTGFKGSWLSIFLKEIGATVLGYSLEPPSNPNNFSAANLSKKLVNVYGDVRVFSHLMRIFTEFQPEFVFHLAAQSLVRRSYQEPLMTFETNVMGSVNVAESARMTPSVRVCINVTSDKCYENREWIWGYRENDHLGGHDPYSSSKACAELVTQAYIRSFFNHAGSAGIASVRAGNVIGGGDWGADRLIPDCIFALSKGEQIEIRNPQAVRPWQHVLEPLFGYVLLASKLANNPKEFMGPWNFGPKNENFISVSEMADKLIRYWGGGKWKDISVESINKPHEMNVLKLNSDKAYSSLQWRSILNVDAAIKMTIDWYKMFYQSSDIDMYDFCANQIKDYFSLMQDMVN